MDLDRVDGQPNPALIKDTFQEVRVQFSLYWLRSRPQVL